MATKNAVIFSLIPLSGETAQALQQGASMVCRMRTASSARQDGTHHVVVFSCGPDEYVMEGVGVAEKK